MPPACVCSMRLPGASLCLVEVLLILADGDIIINTNIHNNDNNTYTTTNNNTKIIITYK